MAFTDEERRIIRNLARASVEFGLVHGSPLRCTESDFSTALCAHRASFVTLHDDGQLVGCVGTLRPRRSLVRDVVHNAFHAAFSDPRFPPLRAAQLPRLELHVSILSALEPICAASEADLLQQLRPGRDGLVIEDGSAAATFLPVMWERLPEPREFLYALEDKADLPPGYWSLTLRAFRYTAEEA